MLVPEKTFKAKILESIIFSTIFGFIFTSILFLSSILLRITHINGWYKLDLVDFVGISFLVSSITMLITAKFHLKQKILWLVLIFVFISIIASFIAASLMAVGGNPGESSWKGLVVYITILGYIAYPFVIICIFILLLFPTLRILLIYALLAFLFNVLFPLDLILKIMSPVEGYFWGYILLICYKKFTVNYEKAFSTNLYFTIGGSILSLIMSSSYNMSKYHITFLLLLPVIFSFLKLLYDFFKMRNKDGQ